MVFAGSKDAAGRWGGYGHFGCCTLLVVERVLDLETPDPRLLDARSAADQPKNCGEYRWMMPVHPVEVVRGWQREAESGSRAWPFEYSRRVAVETIRKLGVARAEVLLEPGVRRGRAVYAFHASNDGKRYMVVVSRPLWAVAFAADRGRVAWAPIAAFELAATCKV